LQDNQLLRTLGGSFFICIWGTISQVLLELIWAPDWASRSTTTIQEMPGHHNGRDITSYHPGLHFTPSQVNSTHQSSDAHFCL